MPRHVISVEVKTLCAQNIRTSYDQDALKRLAESLKKGQKNPILISGTTIIDGHRRVAAAQLAGILLLDAIDCDGMTEDEIREWQTTHAFHSEALSDFDKAGALKEKKDQGLSSGQIAAMFNIDGGMATKYLSLFDCIEAAQEAARAGKIGVTKWYAVSRSPDQEATLARLLGGATRDEVAKTVRKVGVAGTIKTKVIELVLESGITVIFKGAVTLDGAIDAAAEVDSTLQKAKKQGHDAQTFATSLKNRKKATKPVANGKAD